MSDKTQRQETVADLLLWRDENTHRILKKVAKQHDIDINALAELLHWQREYQKVSKSRNRNETFDDIFENTKYW